MTWSIGLATGACIDRPICDVLGTLHEAGASGVELGTPPRHFDLWKAGEVAAVSDRLCRLPLQAISIHAPFGESQDLAHHGERIGVLANRTAPTVCGGVALTGHWDPPVFAFAVR